MSVMFNSILRSAELDPKAVCVVRHKDARADKGRSPYELWRDHPDLFDDYQSHQNRSKRGVFSQPYWAVFVVDAFGDTMFVGIHAAEYCGSIREDRPKPQTDEELNEVGSCDRYELKLDHRLSELIGRLFIDWGQGYLSYAQYADRNDKPVTELRAQGSEPEFPGFLNFIKPLSEIAKLPKAWEVTLKSSQGIYLLTCPRTKEQYVGMAAGADGFFGRWKHYLQDGHGGNVGLKSREPSDYQVSILEVAGTSASLEDIRAMETLWKQKLKSKEMGLNNN